VINELVNAGEWSELNDRLQNARFGTGGLRDAQSEKIVTAAERGEAKSELPPQVPCIGTNAMNFFNLNRATQGLVAYLRAWKDRSADSAKPKLVIAADTRFFSPRICKAERAGCGRARMAATRLSSTARDRRRSFHSQFGISA